MAVWQLTTSWLLNIGSTEEEKNNKKAPFSAVIDHLMYELLLNNTGNFDFGRETRIKLCLKDYS